MTWFLDLKEFRYVVGDKADLQISPPENVVGVSVGVCLRHRKHHGR